MLKTIIIIPTFNEHGKIGDLIRVLLEQFKRVQYELHILVVDDNSPDGAAAGEVQSLQVNNDNLHSTYCKQTRYLKWTRVSPIILKIFPGC